MKNALTSFSDVRLSRTEMKKILGGGVYCVVSTTYSDGNGGTFTIKQGGNCAASTVSECKQNASNNCGGTSCSSNCYYS